MASEGADDLDPTEVGFVGLVWLAIGTMFGALLNQEGVTNWFESAIAGLLIVPACIALAYGLGWVAIRTIWAFNSVVSADD